MIINSTYGRADGSGIMDLTVKRRTLLGLLLSGAALSIVPAPAWAAGKTGILILAHGVHAMGGPGHGAPGGDHGDHAAHADHADHKPPANPWHANVEDIVRQLDKAQPTDVAFGMADPATIQAAVTRLEARGVTAIAAIPLFVSSHSPIIGNSRYILGVQSTLARNTQLKSLPRVNSKAAFTVSGAMDAHPLISEILADRARRKPGPRENQCRHHRPRSQRRG
jgi:hypothetical protein